MNELDYLNYQRISEQEIETKLKNLYINQNTNSFIQLFKLILNSSQLFIDFYITNIKESDITLKYMINNIIKLCEYILYDIELTKHKRNNETYIIEDKNKKFNLYDY
jgi:hypothetical protein